MLKEKSEEKTGNEPPSAFILIAETPEDHNTVMFDMYLATNEAMGILQAAYH